MKEKTEYRSYDELKRAFELDYNAHGSSGCGDTLYPLAKAVALSVLAKTLDPQRKAAAERSAVSNGGMNPALLAIRRDIVADYAALENVSAASNAATEKRYTKDGDLEDIVVDLAAWDRVSALIDERLGDGMDLVHTAAVALLEQAAEHAHKGAGWLDAVVIVRRISRRVVIKLDDTAAYRDDETAPMREVYREVRRAIISARAVQVDPRNPYLYIPIDGMDGEEADAMFYRAGKYHDLGSETADGTYTASATVTELSTLETIVQSLNLTARQAKVLDLRLQGNGDKAIASYLGVTRQAVQKTREQIAKKAIDAGLAMVN